MRPTPLAAVLAVALCAPAQAEDFSVQTTNGNTFSPAALTIKPGDSVTFSNPTGGFHNVAWVEGTFDDGQQAAPPDPNPVWPTDPTRTFPAEGTFRFYCEQHGTPAGAGMAGTVTVSTTSAPPPDETPPTLAKVRAGYRKHVPFVAFTLSEPARVSAALVRRKTGRVLKRHKPSLAAGPQRIKFGKRTLKPGRYSVVLLAEDAAGNPSQVREPRFRVR